ncbi:PTS sugar transporter subunit IIA [Streptococcus danieliae]|uniref:PTS sugar transporter subunit IIA n=1 Tax=Streptococcus danieliae TaxID=747656 RepID=UPI0021C81720|nr:PTS sugar transporter subunit IIA [Streptococcus danieliae]MCU0081699.1 PTS sugar transporter subunit IIA [Streptococcus danieliae]
MTNSIALLLMSHGTFAHSAMKSAELIIGRQENYETVGIDVVDDVDALEQEMMEKVESLDQSNGLIILTDIIGGTPTNLASRLLQNSTTILVSGLNLPLVLDVCMNRQMNLDSVVGSLEAAYAQGFTIRTITDVMGGEEDEYSL